MKISSGMEARIRNVIGQSPLNVKPVPKAGEIGDRFAERGTYKPTKRNVTKPTEQEPKVGYLGTHFDKRA